jgi:hypothetical protein
MVAGIQEWELHKVNNQPSWHGAVLKELIVIQLAK